LSLLLFRLQWRFISEISTVDRSNRPRTRMISNVSAVAQPFNMLCLLSCVSSRVTCGHMVDHRTESQSTKPLQLSDRITLAGCYQTSIMR
jgi:hypothetical protein